MSAIALVLAASFAAAPASAGEGRDRSKVALLPLKCHRDVPGEICQLLADSIALALADAPGIEPITPGDLEVLVGAHALSQLSSCGGETCFIGDEVMRINAAWLIGGDITSLGKKNRTVLRLVDLERGAVLDRGEVTTEPDEAEMDRAVRLLALKLLARRGLLDLEASAGTSLSAMQDEPEPPPSPLLWAGLGTVGVGAVALVGAGALGSLALLSLEDARTAPGDAFQGHARDARMQAWGADVLLGAGGALLVGGAILALTGAL